MATKPVTFTLDSECIKQLELFRNKRKWNKSATVRIAVEYLFRHEFPEVNRKRLTVGRPKRKSKL